MKNGNDGVTAFPLAWPEGWPRTLAFQRKWGGNFRIHDRMAHSSALVTFDHSRTLLLKELERMGVSSVTLSTNIPLRLDGQARAGAAVGKIDDPGVAVYFSFKGRAMVMAADAYESVAGNLRSVGLAVEALRQLERHGGGVMMERAFAGFAALPPPADAPKAKRPWWVVLNYGPDPEARADLSIDEVKARFNVLAKRRHPDAGGSADLFHELMQARDDAAREVGA